MTPKISVALATFNGARFLPAQLDSLLRQSFPPYELVVSDDSSTDETLALLERFAKAAPFPVRIHANERKLGFGANFLTAAELCHGEWVAFCDQDDVWHEEKLARVASKIAAPPVPDLVLISHAVTLTDEGLRPLKAVLPDLQGDRLYPRRAHRCLWVVNGMAQIVLRRLILEFDWRGAPDFGRSSGKTFGHDNWVCLIANALGARVNIGNVCAFHRRHGATATAKRSKRASGWTDRARQAFVESPDYAVEAKQMAEFRDYLRRLAARAGEPDRGHLLQHADDFERRRKLAEARADLWREPRFPRRAMRLAENLKQGLYTMPPPSPQETNALLKDAARASGLL